MNIEFDSVIFFVSTPCQGPALYYESGGNEVTVQNG